MVILGIGGLGHRDAAAAVLVDGRTVAACAEERLTRVKRQGGWPRRAAAACLAAAGVRGDAVDVVAVAANPWLPLREQVLAWYGQGFFESERFQAFHTFHDERHEPLLWLKALEDLRRAGRPRVEIVRHHLAHAAAGFFSGSDEEAGVLVLDGRGETSASALAVGRGAAVEASLVVSMPHSLGLLAASVADFLGFREQDDEFRVMSISSTGSPRFLDALRGMVRLLPGGGYALDPAWFAFHEGRAALSSRFRDAFGSPREAGAAVEDRHRDLAASLQRVLEETAVHMARALRERTAAETLHLSGTLAQNWALNGRLAREAPFARVAASPFGGDDGTAVGAAMAAYAAATGRRPAAPPDAFLGPDLPAAAVEAALRDCGLPAETPADPAAAAAALLAAGRIVGVARGRAEFGPRALGGRSILAAAGDAAVLERLRRTVKSRESHHPFGVSMTREEAGRVLEDGRTAPHMLVPAVVKPAARGRLAGLVLGDGTLRVHTVDRDRDPFLHALLAALGRARGLEAAVNTSLNVPGRPLSTNALECLSCFWTTGMDALVLGDRLLRKAGVA